MAYAPTLTPQTDFAPVPRVEIVFSTVHASAVTATVYRLAGSRTHPVRGGINVAAAGGFSIPPDTEAPTDQVIAYRAEMFDVNGDSLGFTDATETTVDYTGTIIQNITDPARNVEVILLEGTASELVRPFYGEAVRPLGRTLPVWIGSGRGGLVGVPLLVETDTTEQEAALQSVFGEYDDTQLPVVCIRTTEPAGLPTPFFALVQEPTRIDIDVKWGGEHVHWQLDAIEVAAPAAAIFTAFLTYADIEASQTTYSALEAAYLTYLAVESDYSLAGSA